MFVVVAARSDGSWRPKTPPSPPSVSFVYSFAVCACFSRFLMSCSFGVSFVYSFVVFFSVFVFHGRCLILVFRVSLSFSVFVISCFISDSGFSFSA